MELIEKNQAFQRENDNYWVRLFEEACSFTQPHLNNFNSQWSLLKTIEKFNKSYSLSKSKEVQKKQKTAKRYRDKTPKNHTTEEDLKKDILTSIKKHVYTDGSELKVSNRIFRE